MNDGCGTGISFRDNTASAFDLTLLSMSFAGVCSWKVTKETTHYDPVAPKESNQDLNS